MNRIIKFRAWNSNTHEMISWNQMGDDHWDLWDEFMKCDTMMQFTGIIDRGGREIFEGDVVKVEYGIGQVIFHHGSFMIEWIDDKEANMELLGERCLARNIFRTRTDLEVIGNIFEHKHLLK